MKVGIVGELPGVLPGRVTGGAERQLLLLARYLSKRGHEVTCVVPGLGQEACLGDGPRIASGWDGSVGLRGVRLFTYRLPHLRRCLETLSADVLYVRGYSLVAHTVVTTARRLGSVSIVGLAHDTDLRRNRARLVQRHSNWPTKIAGGRIAFSLAWWPALRQADFVAAQTSEQLQRCQELGLAGVLLANIVEGAGIDGGRNTPTSDVVWVGALAERKGVPQLVQLAKRLADVRFSVVGALTDGSLSRCAQELAALPNVQWTRGLAHHEVMSEIASSRVLVNTSRYEGFANTLLEAWCAGVPVATLHVNPDGLLDGPEPLGCSARGSVDRMAAQIRQLLASPALRTSMGERGQRYVRETHSPETVCVRFESLVRSKLQLTETGA